jgi:hypothetical protein
MDTQHNPTTPTAVVRRKGKELEPGDAVYLESQPEPITLGPVLYVHSSRLRMFQIGSQEKLTVISEQWFCVKASR